MTLIQDSIGVGRNTLLGGRVEVVRARVVLVRRRELDRVLNISVENKALVFQVVELEKNCIQMLTSSSHSLDVSVIMVWDE